MSLPETKEDDAASKTALEEIQLENLSAFFEMLSTLRPFAMLNKKNVLRKLLTGKMADNAKYVDLKLSYVDLAKYAAVAMVMGWPRYIMPLPDFIVFLGNIGFDAKKLTEYSLWAEQLGIVEYAEAEDPEEAYQKWEMQYLQNNKNDMDARKREHDQKLEAYKGFSIEETQKELALKQNEALEYNSFLLHEQEKMEQLVQHQPRYPNIEDRKTKLRISSEIIMLSFYLKLTRSEVEALSTTLQATRLLEQKNEALSEQKRREEKEASGMPFCKQSMDFFDPGNDLIIGQTTDPNDPNEPMTTVSIAVMDNNLLARHCYVREQLAQYFDSKPKIYTWMTPPRGVFTPPAWLGQRLYQLPMGNVIITTKSYNKLLNGPSKNFRLALLKGTQRMGALRHTESSFWNREEPVYKLVALDTNEVDDEPEFDNPAFADMVPPDDDDYEPASRRDLALLLGNAPDVEPVFNYSERIPEPNFMNADEIGLYLSGAQSFLTPEEQALLSSSQMPPMIGEGVPLESIPQPDQKVQQLQDRENELQGIFQDLSVYDLLGLFDIRQQLLEQPNMPTADIYNQRLLALDAARDALFAAEVSLESIPQPDQKVQQLQDRENELEVFFQDLSVYDLRGLFDIRQQLLEQPNMPTADIYNQRLLALDAARDALIAAEG
jgi:hypothetical protein